MQLVDCASGKFRWWWRLLLICSYNRQFGAIIYVSCICVVITHLWWLKYLMKESMTFSVFCAQLKQEPVQLKLSRNRSHLLPKCLWRGSLCKWYRIQISHFNMPNFPSVEKVLAVGVQDVLSLYIYISKHQFIIHMNMKKISFLIPQSACGGCFKCVS